MTGFENLPNEIASAFSVLPVPERIFRDSSYFTANSDIAQSLEEMIAGKRWDFLSLHDWVMVGTTPGVARYYMSAHAFHYYIPSILTLVCQTGQYPEFAIDSLTPPSAKETPIDDELNAWWKIFVSNFKPSEKTAVSKFAQYIMARSDIFSFERDSLEVSWLRQI